MRNVIPLKTLVPELLHENLSRLTTHVSRLTNEDSLFMLRLSLSLSLFSLFTLHSSLN